MRYFLYFFGIDGNKLALGLGFLVANFLDGLVEFCGYGLDDGLKVGLGVEGGG
jgi:hypothetical protein